MNPIPQPTPELRELVDRCLDGTLDDLSRFRLERLIREDKTALAYYLELAGNDALIAAELGAATSLQGHGAHTRRRVVWLSAAAIVAGLAVAVTLVSNGKRASEVVRQTSVTAKEGMTTGVPARITGLVGVRTSGNQSLQLAARPPDPRITFGSGLLELTLDLGTTVLLEGPADIEVTGPNSCRLGRGRLVANVPLQAKGFTVDYRDGHVVDHGTEFALDVDESGAAREVGVFRGEVEVFEPNTKDGLTLFTDYAVKRTESGLESSSFDRGNFVREIPVREFAWDMRDTRIAQTKDFRYDISSLMHGAGEFRIIFRHLQGKDTIQIHHVELCRDGNPVASSDAMAFTSRLDLPGRSNDYRLRVPEDQWKPGRWELRFRASTTATANRQRSSTSQGIVCFEEGLSVQARPENFMGLWAYSHGNATYVRDIRKDGSVVLFRDGKQVSREAFEGKWTVSDNVLEINFTNGAAPEKHCLRDVNTLIFLSKPYRNAHRVASVTN